MLHCHNCGFQATTKEEESTIHYHHILPKFMGGNDSNGRIALCKKCHDILHNKIAPILWNFIPKQLKEECQRKVIEYTIKNYKKN